MNTVVATNQVFEMTSNDLCWPKMTWKMKVFSLWFYAYQTKARNQGNTVAATNPVFDLDYKAIVKSFLYCR